MFGDHYTRNPGLDPQKALAVAVNKAISSWEGTNGYFVQELKVKALEEILDTLFGPRCVGCGDRGGYHGPGVCV